jgi:hypothetical protein
MCPKLEGARKLQCFALALAPNEHLGEVSVWL